MDEFNELMRYAEAQAAKTVGEIEAQLTVEEFKGVVDVLMQVIEDMERRAGRKMDRRSVVGHAVASGMIWGAQNIKPSIPSQHLAS